jgi:hypothetical protein
MKTFSRLWLSRRILPRMIICLYKRFRENQNSHFVFNNFFPENRAVYEIISKNMVELERPQFAKWRRVTCRISKATRAQAHAWPVHPPTHPHTHTHIQKYVILIPFRRQSGFVNAPQYYVIRALPILLFPLLSTCIKSCFANEVLIRRFQSSAILFCVVREIITDVSKDRCFIIFTVKQSKPFILLGLKLEGLAILRNVSVYPATEINITKHVRLQQQHHCCGELQIS